MPYINVDIGGKKNLICVFFAWHVIVEEGKKLAAAKVSNVFLVLIQCSKQINLLTVEQDLRKPYKPSS
jgi:hypothetical protein